MILRQYYLGCLAHASYLIGDERTHGAVIVDPRRDVDEYIHEADNLGLDIRHVFLTHFHADFVAGHLELRDRTGALIHLGARALADYPFVPHRSGDTLPLGDVRLQVLETPGHTPESISLLVFDLKVSSERPHAVLTGDTLFIGDVGRPDLLASFGVTAVELAGQLFDSLHNKLLSLPDETLVYPAHGAGSRCGKSLGTDTVSSIGVQRRYNYALQPMTRQEFIRLVTADQPEVPAYFGYDAHLNRRERPTLELTFERILRPLALDEVLRLKNAGAQLLDVREAIDFAGAHLLDSLHIGLGGKFATWAGSLLDPERPIVLVTEPSQETEAASRLGRMGFDHVAGYLDDGMAALVERPDLVRRVDRITAGTLREQLAAEEPPLVIDVREPKEWQADRIPGSRNIPLAELREQVADLPRQRPLVVHCASGYRSSIAASLLKQAGFVFVADLIGGMTAWHRTAGAAGASR